MRIGRLGRGGLMQKALWVRLRTLRELGAPAGFEKRQDVTGFRF